MTGRDVALAGISSMATRHVLADLAAEYERQTGTAVTVEAVGGVEAAKRVAAGEAFDFVVLASAALAPLEAAGRIVPGSRISIARSGVAVAVACGARHPDIASESALRQAVLDAASLGYSTGPSGTQLLKLFERWGIADAIRSRLVQAPPGVPVGELVARGDVELGFQQLSELIPLEGIDVLGPLPPEVQVMTVFSGAICSASTRREAARGFLAFAASAGTEAAKRRHGMEPGDSR